MSLITIPQHEPRYGYIPIGQLKPPMALSHLGACSEHPTPHSLASNLLSYCVLHKTLILQALDRGSPFFHDCTLSLLTERSQLARGCVHAFRNLADHVT